LSTCSCLAKALRAIAKPALNLDPNYRRVSLIHRFGGDGRVHHHSRFSRVLALTVFLNLPVFLCAGETPAALTSPAPGSTFSGSTVTFSWSKEAGATRYKLYLGTTGAGSRNLYDSGDITATSAKVSGLPESGLTVYATLYSQYDDAWHREGYTYKEKNSTQSIVGLSCTKASITGSGTDTCTATLNTAASSSGFKVALASSSTAVSVPSSVTVAADATTVSFSATASAVSAAQSVTLTASAGSSSKTYALELNAYVAKLSINATSIAFGDVAVKSPATQSLTLTSSGSAPVTVSAATISGSEFSFSGATLPLTLNPDQDATLSVEFDPTTTGAATGTLTISSNSSTNPTTAISLTGTGGSSESYQVNLAWDAPASSPDPVAKYNIYRSPSGSSSYALMGSVTSGELAYTDTNSIQGGQTYDYIVESVDASGNESVPSNMASVSVP
jgi:centrosomal CEP192-like protein